jgi:hypothetical protein
MPAAVIIVAVLGLAVLAIAGGMAANAAATATAPDTETAPVATQPDYFLNGPTAPVQIETNDSGVEMHRSDSSLTGSEITADVSSWPGSDKIWNICAAVALAEGFNEGQGTAPYDLNNPGDLSPGDEAGQATGGPPQTHDGSSIICFATAEGGWNALYAKFAHIVNGHSHVYPATWTWAQVAQKYAGDSANWLKNVTDYLGVDPSTTPAQYVKG